MNPSYQDVKVVLFDSGHTLNRPMTGHWMIPPKFEEILDPRKFNINSLFSKYAMYVAQQYLNENHLIKNEQEEYAQFREFYSIFLKKCRYPALTEDIIDALAYNAVYNDDKFVFFDDVEPVVKDLYDKYILGVLSDTWPSLDRVFVNKGLRQYFSHFIMSSVHGEYKQNGKLFEIAIDETKHRPSEILFVDDSELNLTIAQNYGMIPVKICRYKAKKVKCKFKQISSLDELKQLLL